MSTPTNKLIHDIRNPLNAIAMNAELGKLTLETKQDVERALKLFDVILKECQNCSGKLSELKTSIDDQPPENNNE